MSPATGTGVGGLEVRIDGAALDPVVAERLLDARVQDDLLLPDTFQLRFRDPAFELVDGTAMAVGKKVELRFSGPGGSGQSKVVFTGTIATIAPEFEASGCVFVVRGYDLSHSLNLIPRSQTFQDMTTADIAKKVITDAGLQADVTATTEVAAFEQQSNETDWNFLWRLAARCGFTVSCLDGVVKFRPGGKSEDPAIRLEWGTGLRSFHPRATAVQQVDEVEISSWDPASAQRVVGSATNANLDSKIGLDRSHTADAGAGGKLVVSNQIVTTQGEAQVLAQSTLDHLANAWLEAEGSADGDPRIGAGALVEIVGVGQRFGGNYLITGATHIVRGGHGYETRFRVSGRARRTLLDLLSPAPNPGYGESLVIGLVTNVDDPAGQNRVRVKFPALDEGHDGWWARVTSMAASGPRGLMMMPLVGDEVIVGFEQGDARRPLVLGSLWNGSAPPGDLVRNSSQSSGGKTSDGSFNLSSDQAITMKAGQEIHLEGQKLEAKLDTDASIEAGTDLKFKGGKVTLSGDGSVTIESNGSVKVSGTAIEVSASGTLKLSGASVMIG